MKIYTKTGDKGETGLYGGKRISKSSVIIEVLGVIDELNAYLGAINLPELENIQRDLMAISSAIAGQKRQIPDAKKLENQIDKMEEVLPKLQNFILPKGEVHYVRTICRRAERRAVTAKVDEDILVYLNRLSDYLFVLARYMNYKNKVKETIWKQN